MTWQSSVGKLGFKLPSAGELMAELNALSKMGTDLIEYTREGWKLKPKPSGPCEDGCFNRPDRWIVKSGKMFCRECGKFIGYEFKEKVKNV